MSNILKACADGNLYVLMWRLSSETKKSNNLINQLFLIACNKGHHLIVEFILLYFFMYRDISNRLNRSDRYYIEDNYIINKYELLSRSYDNYNYTSNTNTNNYIYNTNTICNFLSINRHKLSNNDKPLLSYICGHHILYGINDIIEQGLLKASNAGFDNIIQVIYDSNIISLKDFNSKLVNKIMAISITKQYNKIIRVLWKLYKFDPSIFSIHNIYDSIIISNNVGDYDTIELIFKYLLSYKKNNRIILTYILIYYPNIYKYILDKACKNGFDKIVQLILLQRTELQLLHNVSWDNMINLLEVSSKNGYYKIVEILLDFKYSILDDDGTTSIISYNKINILEAFYEASNIETLNILLTKLQLLFNYNDINELIFSKLKFTLLLSDNNSLILSKLLIQDPRFEFCFIDNNILLDIINNITNITIHKNIILNALILLIEDHKINPISALDYIRNWSTYYMNDNVYKTYYNYTTIVNEIIKLFQTKCLEVIYPLCIDEIDSDVIKHVLIKFL